MSSLMALGANDGGRKIVWPRCEDFSGNDSLYGRVVRAPSKGRFANDVHKPHAQQRGWSRPPVVGRAGRRYSDGLSCWGGRALVAASLGLGGGGTGSVGGLPAR